MKKKDAATLLHVMLDLIVSYNCRYDRAALKLVPRHTAQAPRRLTAGDRVVLSIDYSCFSDAFRGPLRRGDVGVIETDDLSGVYVRY